MNPRTKMLLACALALVGVAAAAYTLWPNTAPRQWPSDAQRAQGGRAPGGPAPAPSGDFTRRVEAPADGAAAATPPASAPAPGAFVPTANPTDLSAAMRDMESRLVEITQKPAGSFGDAEKVAALARAFFEAALAGDSAKAGALLEGGRAEPAAGEPPRRMDNPLVKLLRSAGLDTEHMTVRAVDPKSAAAGMGMGPPPGPPPAGAPAGGPGPARRRMVVMTAAPPGAADGPSFAKLLDITAPVLPEGAAPATGAGEVTLRVGLDAKTNQWRITGMQADGFDSEAMKRAMRRDK